VSALRNRWSLDQIDHRSYFGTICEILGSTVANRCLPGPTWVAPADRAQPGAMDAGPAYNRPLMRRALVERSLRDVHARLVRVREELSVLDEQLVVFNDAVDEARIRSLVSETPLAGHDYSDAQRTADAANRERASLLASIGELERRQDELLGRLVAGPR